MSQSIERIRNRSKALLESPAPDMDGNFPRRDTIRYLHQSLMAFGGRLFEFFDKGFYETDAGYRLEPSVAYPQEYVLDTILAQISHDIGAIQKAYQQRAVPELAERLQTADNLAYMSLQPAVDQGVLPVTTVLTYFHKSPNVRVIPYAPVALVGIPFSARSPENNYDLLATPHEVGHYVYRHGRVPKTKGDRLRTKLEHTVLTSFAPEQRWVLQWMEEIFADAYGCLVATEAMTESFRDILISHSGDQFIGDTHKHPIPAVRMYVYTTALEKFGYESIAKRFECEWEGILNHRGRPSTFLVNDAKGQITFADAKTIFQETMDCFAESTKLASLHKDKRKKTYSTWGKGGGSAFDNFVSTLNQDDSISIPELRIEDEKITVNRKNEYDFSDRKLGDTNTWIDIIKEKPELEAPIPPVAWGAVFESLDWTVERPHGRS